MITVLDDNLMSDEAVRDPYTYFGRLRESNPVYWNELYRGWIITRHDDVSAALRHPALSAKRIGPLDEREDIADAVAILHKWMVFNDPPDYTRLRVPARAAFTPRRVERLANRVQVLVDELLDSIAERGSMDVVQDFAFPLPTMVITELLGVPARDRGIFRGWPDKLPGLIFGALDQPDRHERGRHGMLALKTYFEDLLVYYEHHPADNLLCSLLTQEKATLLTREEVVATAILLLFAGHETTANLLARGLLALLEHPAQMMQLHGQPGLAVKAVEELLRYDGPTKTTPRWVSEDFTMHDCIINAGQRVLLVQAAANRDPRHFDAPNDVILDRADNQHLGFGYGIHFCLGAPLARLEGKIAISTILLRFPHLERENTRLEWQPNLIGRALKSLPVRTR